MFSLIIVIVSIALVAALALATIYYGGERFSDGRTKANAARLANEGSQLKAALTVYQTTLRTEATSQADLIAAQLLKSELEGWNVADGYVFNPEPSEAVCTALNAQQGITVTPECSDTTSNAPCCVVL